MSTMMVSREWTDVLNPVTEDQTPQRVLFLCRENNARSQMAEALFRLLSRGTIEVVSAGISPTYVHPYAIHILAAINIDSSHLQAKHVSLFRSQHFDRVIALCDPEREFCPCGLGDARHCCWRFPDPTLVKGTEEEKYHAFELTGLQLATRIRYLLIFLQREKEREM